MLLQLPEDQMLMTNINNQDHWSHPASQLLYLNVTVIHKIAATVTIKIQDQDQELAVCVQFPL